MSIGRYNFVKKIREGKYYGTSYSSTIIFIITALAINFAFGKRISESIDKGIYNVIINIIALFFAVICLL